MDTRKILVFMLVLLISLMGMAPGCKDKTNVTDQRGSVKNDLEGLKKFIHLPDDIIRCEWQTGNRVRNGNDWWLAAVLEVAPEKTHVFLPGTATREALETPPGLALKSSFASLTSIAGAQMLESNQVLIITETYEVKPYVNSPLLHGKAIKLSTDRVFVVLWTN